jgi:hypothetical protein
MKIKYIAPVLIAIACLGLQQAKADVFTSSLNVGNSGISSFSGPFGTVSITLTSSTTATVTFTGNTVAGNQYLFGGAQALDLNVNATTFTATNFSFANSGTGFTPGPLANGNPIGSGTVDGFGSFNLTIDLFDGFTHSVDTATFTLTNTSGTWASAASVLTPNLSGNDAAAHVFVTSSPANASNSAIITGFAAEHGGGVPDGGTTVMLLGVALGARGMARRVLMSEPVERSNLAKKLGIKVAVR